ncbi:chaperone protein dnaJ C76, chloroplastic-like [Lolium perenne]|uniref:chaperone protein dnaJ C76, chloroplastic-like n=1 Tax=Lolium perenne TaxID=4522 RepID=UPI003A997B28
MPFYPRDNTAVPAPPPASNTITTPVCCDCSCPTPPPCLPRLCPTPLPYNFIGTPTPAGGGGMSAHGVEGLVFGIIVVILSRSSWYAGTLVRFSQANAAGSPDIFAEVSKFKARFQEMEQRSTTRQSEESEVARQSRTSAVQTIMSLSNWWYWRPFRAPAGAAAAAAVPAPLRLLPPPRSPPPSAATDDPVTERLKEAAARRKAEGTAASAVHARRRDEYWTPQLNLPSSASFPTPGAQTDRPPKRERLRRPATGERAPTRRARIDLTAPLLMGIVAAGIVGYNREDMAGGLIEDHIGGAAAVEVVNSFELQVVLAGVTWFVIGAAVAGFVQVLVRRNEFRE